MGKKEEKKYVVLVELKKDTRWPRVPNIGEYKNKFITAVTPCSCEKGVYTSWETGEKVEKTPDTLEWGLLVGTMFRLTDGREILITRNCRGEEYLIDNVPFNPLTMVRYEAKRYVEEKN